MTVKAWLYDASMGRSEERHLFNFLTRFPMVTKFQWMRKIFLHIFLYIRAYVLFFSSCCLCFGSVRVGGERDV